MKIGTPLSQSALRVMLLGSGELGKEVILSLQRYGVEVIAVDRYPNAPGHQVAHRAHTINMADSSALRALIEKERPHILVPEIEAIATDLLAEVEREGLAEVIPTARAVQLTMNREGIRRLAAEELGLPTSRYAFASSFEELREGAEKVTAYPCVVKPVMSSSGKGQSVARSPEDLKKSWDYAMSGGRVSHGRVIVEEMIAFDFEITLLTVRSFSRRSTGAAGVARFEQSQSQSANEERSRRPDHPGEIETSFCEPVGHIQINGDYVESWQPQAMSPKALEEAKRIAKRITDGLGGRGIFGVEMFVKGDQVYFSEVSPRPHDTGMVTMASQNQSEFELHARAILGLPVSTTMLRPGASAVIYGGMEEKGIAFEGLEKALAIPGTEVRLFGKPESFVKRRMGVALAFDDDLAVAREKAKRAAALVVPVRG